MRVWIMAGLVGAAAVSLAACHQPASGDAAANTAAGGAPAAAPAAAGALTADQFPHRRAGLWKQVNSMDGAAADGPGMQLCVDDASEAKLNLSAMQGVQGMHCTQAFTRNIDGSIGVDSTCQSTRYGASHTTGTIRGDFNTSYVIDMHTTTTGSPIAQMNGATTMTITGTWVGPCAPGQRPGDLIMPNGQTRNLLDDHPAPPAG